MYAFYSLLVYIFYTVFKKEDEEEEEGALEEPAHVSMATVSMRRDGHAPKKKKQACARLSDSSECSTTVVVELVWQRQRSAVSK
ncbi:unnamed protein product [Arctogadus glacialis]